MKTNGTEIRVYIKEQCPYCQRALQIIRLLLDDADLKVVNLQNDQQTRRQIAKATGHTTMPAIFIGETFIGGCSELEDAIFSGRVRSILLKQSLLEKVIDFIGRYLSRG